MWTILGILFIVIAILKWNWLAFVGLVIVTAFNIIKVLAEVITVYKCSSRALLWRIFGGIIVTLPNVIVSIIGCWIILWAMA